MSKKLKLISNHRYTKKIPQFFGGADDDKYNINITTDPKEVIDFLSKQITEGFIVENQKKVTKVTVPKVNKTDFENLLQKQKDTVAGFDFKQTSITCLRSCDYELTTPMGETFESTKQYFNPPNVVPPPVVYRTEVKIPADKLETLKYTAKKYKLEVKDKKGNSLPQMKDSEFKTFEMGLTVSGLKNDTIAKNKEATVSQVEGTAKVSDIKYTDIKYDEQRFADLYELLVASNPIPFEKTDSTDGVAKKQLKLKDILPVPRDQRKKEELFNILSELETKMDLFCSLASVENSITASIEYNNAVDEVVRGFGLDVNDSTVKTLLNEVKIKLKADDCLTLKHILVKSVAIDIFVIQDSFANESAQSLGEKMDFKITKSLVGADGWWWVGKVPFFLIEKIADKCRSMYLGYGKLTFDTDDAAREMLNKKRADAVNGTKNEFSLMSAFVGTEAQKTAAKTGIILGIASTGWAIVGKIQQNPALAAVIMGAVSATGVGGILTGSILIACGVAYYTVLKLKEKYNSYYEINRSLNELTILLHRIQKLIRLSVLVSNTYNFDIAINEIAEQLKILFSRFDEMLKQDDYNGIQGMINKNATPDLDMVKVVKDAATDAAKENQLNADQERKDKGLLARAKERVTAAAKSVGDALKRAKKNIGSFIYVMTFDQELWYRKLNNDIIKLNIYLSTTIGEFNLVLNVLQMEYITKGLSGEQTAVTALIKKQEHIKGSSEYMRMLIGILLNDILKLRVDLSYCSRTNTAAIVSVSTKDEPVCLGYQDTDGGGNIVTTYRRQLHAMIISLVERLNDRNSVYSTSKGLKDKVFAEVVEPYKKMFDKVVPGIPPDVESALKASKKYDSLNQRIIDKINARKGDFDASKDKEKAKLQLVKVGGILGIGDKKSTTDKSVAVTPQQTEDNMIEKIVKYVVSEPYSTIPDEELSKYLNSVYDFSKKEGKTTEAETKEAVETAKQVAQLAPSQEAVAIGAQALADQSLASTVEKEAAADTTGAVSGGRRLTRKRILKLKKNHHHRRVSRTRAPFKSAAAALAAFRRG